MSTTFENFIKAKDKIKAKEKIDKQNHEANKKAKYETLVKIYTKGAQKETKLEIK